MKVADMHCDTILAILRGREQGKEISLRKNNLNLELSESAWISGKSDWRRICRKSLFRSRIWAYSAWD